MGVGVIGYGGLEGDVIVEVLGDFVVRVFVNTGFGFFVCRVLSFLRKIFWDL